MNSKITLLLILLCITQISKVYPCINEYEEDYTKIDGSYTKITNEEEGSPNYYFSRYFDSSQWLVRKNNFEEAIKAGNASFKTKSDYASILLKLGSYKEGLKILQALYADHPDEYNIVVNLGTAYELNGKPELALQFIKKAVKLNPDSHEGSEWIHVKILEAMVAQKKNKDYLKDHSILQLGMSHNLREEFTNLSEEKLSRYHEIRDQLAWQLKERIYFVSPPDAYVADLLFDLANLVALTQSIETALPVYDQALEYYPANMEKVLNVRDSLKEELYWTTFRKYSKYLLGLAIGSFALVYLVVRMVRRRKKGVKQPTVNSI